MSEDDARDRPEPDEGDGEEQPLTHAAEPPEREPPEPEPPERHPPPPTHRPEVPEPPEEEPPEEEPLLTHLADLPPDDAGDIGDEYGEPRTA